MLKKRINIYRIVLLFIGLIWINTLWSQRVKIENLVVFDDKEYHFGFFFGASQMLYTIKTKQKFENIDYKLAQFPEIKKEIEWARVTKIGAAPTIGFTIGIISDFRLGKYFNLRFTPDLQFGERVLHYDIEIKDLNSTLETQQYQKRVPSTLLNFPLAIKYKGMRMRNVRPYLIVGGHYTMDLGAQANKTEPNSEAKVITIKLFRDDIYAEAGVGFDFYFNWFKMSTELKMSYGIFDVLSHESYIWTDPIERLNSKLFQFNVTFE